MAYGKVMVHLAQKHGGIGWVAYDTIFRQRAAAWADFRQLLGLTSGSPVKPFPNGCNSPWWEE